jgi:hypothetical protein
VAKRILPPVSTVIPLSVSPNVSKLRRALMPTQPAPSSGAKQPAPLSPTVQKAVAGAKKAANVYANTDEKTKKK